MNTKFFRQLTVLTLLGLLCFTVSCRDKKKNNEPEEPEDAFDKSGMLINYADNIILPAYQSFSISLDSLNQAYSVFKNNPDLPNLHALKSKFVVAYTKYQRCDLFELGPAENTGIRGNFNIFPTDTQQIKTNISTGIYDFSAISNLDAKGFPALDYLFYGKQETVIVASFTNTNTKQYVTDLLNEMTGKCNTVITGWNSSYRNSFINSLGTDIGSSIGLLINQLNYNLDYLKNAKIGIPLGKKSLGIAYPDKCEAFYSSSYSLKYAIETLDLIERVYNGKSLNGSNNKGFDDYLIHLKVQHTSGTLNDAIQTQFSLARTKLMAIAEPLSTQMTTNPTVVDAAYAELVKLLVLLKADLPSSLGVVITYQDGDGD
ncbi:MAG: imelysin family protein [Sphingobacteriaceae bacterium]|nr:imelysin family protein [Sphingobacteriaceae bacterium]